MALILLLLPSPLPTLTPLSYPVVVTEVLAADVERLNTLFISTPKLMSRLLGFFKKPSINLLVANMARSSFPFLLSLRPNLPRL